MAPKTIGITGGLLGCKAGGRPNRHYDIHMLPHQVCRKFLQACAATKSPFENVMDE
jgi:hypothetical protein